MNSLTSCLSSFMTDGLNWMPFDATLQVRSSARALSLAISICLNSSGTLSGALAVSNSPSSMIASTRWLRCVNKISSRAATSEQKKAGVKIPSKSEYRMMNDVAGTAPAGTCVTLDSGTFEM